MLLLSGACRPEVGLAREGIKSLPFDAACKLALLLQRCGVYGPPYGPKRLRARPASDFFAYLAAHREAADALLRFAGVPGAAAEGAASGQGEQLRLPFDPENMLDQLTAAALKQAGYVLLRPNTGVSRILTLLLTKDKDDGFDAEGCFPAWLFCRAAGADEFAVGNQSSRFVDKYFFSCLSRSHPFSVWLIGNRERLREEAPAAYDRLLDGLTGGGRPQSLAKRLNDELDRLRALSGNPFRVPPALRIRPEEIEVYN